MDYMIIKNFDRFPPFPCIITLALLEPSPWKDVTLWFSELFGVHHGMWNGLICFYTSLETSSIYWWYIPDEEGDIFSKI